MDKITNPNHLLAAVMRDAAVSNKGLAARVRQEAQAAGLPITPDHTSVRRWLDGMRPRAETAACIVSALEKKLGRTVSFAEIGFEGLSDPSDEPDVVQDGASYPSEPARSVELLDNLTSADLADDPAVMGADWVSGATPGVITDYLFAVPLWSSESDLRTAVGADVAARIRATVRSITELDFRFGGGHVRQILLSYWKSEVVPELRRDYPEAVRRELFGAAADAAEVLGWSAYDDGRHGAAQRYFIQGLRLSREAEDSMMGGQILSNLSHQANYLGKFDSALRFARAAQSATTRRSTATVTAMFLAMEARALASLGEKKACIATLGRAEQVFEQRDSSSDPDWIGYFDELELAGEAAHCFRDLGLSNETLRFAGEAVDLVRTPPRTRSFISMVSAAGALRAGNVDEAVALAVDSVRTAGPLKSDRYRRYLRDFYQSLPDARVPHAAVRDLIELISIHHPALVLIGRG